MKRHKCVVYIGDFDFRNENVQSFLVKNNGKIFNALGYRVAYIGINREESQEKEIRRLPTVVLENGNTYYELPNTLNIKGVFQYYSIYKSVISYLNCLHGKQNVYYLITYQSPTYALIIKKIAKWCKVNRVKYIVNCADLPTFNLQSLPQRVIMVANWSYLHKTTKQYADGIISVSKFIHDFYYKSGRESVIIPPLFDESHYAFCVPMLNAVPVFIYAGIPFKATKHAAAPEGMKDRLDKVIDLFLMLSEREVMYDFKVVGITKEEYLCGVPRHQDALMKDSKIIFMGRNNHSDTLALVAKSDFSINYRDENKMTKAGFSTKIVESVSVGTPVIINPTSDTFEYLEEGVSCFTLSGSIETDADKIASLCVMNETERLQLKKNCYDRRTFCISRYTETMRQFIYRLDNSSNKAVVL